MMPADDQWWLKPLELISDIPRRMSQQSGSACYRFGGAYLEVDSDYIPMLEGLRLWYGECAVSEPIGPDADRIRCTVRSIEDPPLVLVSFNRPNGSNHETEDLAVFDHLYRAEYSVVPSPIPGWSVVYGSRNANRPFMARNGFRSILDLREEPPGLPPGFLLSYILSAMIGLQREMLFVHAASIGIDGRGALLMGHGGAGKTTLSLTLASRGHSFLGDNQACVRIRSRELLPFPRSAAVKPGPRAQAVNDVLEESPQNSLELPDGRTVILMQVGNCFSLPRVDSIPFKAFFYLRKIAKRPIIEEFEPGMTNHNFVRRLSADSTAVYGVSPARRVMNVMVLMELLSEVPCYFVDAGRPEETAALIERTMEVQ